MEKKSKKKYETPPVIFLGETAKGSGLCQTGSGDATACGTGNGVTGAGTCVFSPTDCTAGPTAGQDCTAGPTACRDCSNGTAALRACTAGVAATVGCTAGGHNITT